MGVHLVQYTDHLPDFFEILGSIHDKFQLVIMGIHEGSDDVRLPPGLFVHQSEFAVLALPRGGGSQLGAEADQIAGDFLVERAGCLDRDMPALGIQDPQQIRQVWRKERLTSGDDDMACWPLGDVFDDA